MMCVYCQQACNISLPHAQQCHVPSNNSSDDNTAHTCTCMLTSHHHKHLHTNYLWYTQDCVDVRVWSVTIGTGGIGLHQACVNRDVLGGGEGGEGG